ncbi:amidohydrolase family protein [Aquirufa ecclesiirivi]
MIDAHQHFWNYQPERDTWITDDMSKIQTDFYPNESQVIFEKNGIQGCIAVQADSSEEETLFLLALAEQNDFIKGVVGWTDLQNEHLESRLEYFSQFEKCVGFRHVIQGEKDPLFFQRPNFIQGVKQLAAFDYTYDILIYPHQLKESVVFAQKVDGQKLIVDHLAKPPYKSNDLTNWKKNMLGFKELEHVSAKISGLVTEADWANWTKDEIKETIDVALEVFGPKRLLFGSDYPVVLVASTLEKWLEVFHESIASLSATEQADIKLNNCLAFYQVEL